VSVLCGVINLSGSRAKLSIYSISSGSPLKAIKNGSFIIVFSVPTLWTISKKSLL
jgi:hypothetical protein